MKTISSYTISNTYKIATSGQLSSPALVLRDQKSYSEENLKYLFQDSHTIFRMRVQKLGVLSKTTTDDEARSLRIMLETLIQTKGLLQQIK